MQDHQTREDPAVSFEDMLEAAEKRGEWQQNVLQMTQTSVKQGRRLILSWGVGDISAAASFADARSHQRTSR